MKFTNSFMATDQDFTFPTFSDAISSAVDSPPLWSTSPANSPLRATIKKAEESNKDGIEIHKEVQNHNSRRKSFSCIERAHFWRNKIQENEEEEEENMDMLWEDFNEDLSLKRRQSPSDDDEDTDMGCVQMLKPAALRLSKNGQKAIVSVTKQENSTTGFLMFIKVLKKVVLLDYSHSRSLSLSLKQRNYCSVGRRRRPNNLSW